MFQSQKKLHKKLMGLRTLRLSWPLAISLLISVNAFASDSYQELELLLDGQTNITLEREFEKTIYKEETYQDTCHRTETYDENVCGNETKYRNVCHTVPGFEDCRTINDRVCETRYENKRVCESYRTPEMCRNVTRYRRECRREPSRQDCRTIPGEVRCHRAPNGEQRCEKIPPRRDCRNVPGRETCHDVPYTHRECTPGRVEQRCDYRNVPYQYCQDVPRRDCRWIPERQECSQVPYQENVCRVVTKEKKIPYSCTKTKQVPYQVRDELVIANVEVDFNKSQRSDLNLRATVSIDNQKKVRLETRDFATNTKSVVTLESKLSQNTKDGVRTLSAQYKINVNDYTVVDVLAGARVTSVSLQRSSMTFVLNKEVDFSQVSSAITIRKDGKTHFNNVLDASSMSVTKSAGRTVVSFNVLRNGGSELNGVFDKKFQVSIALTQKVALPSGNIIFENVSKAGETLNYSATVKRD